MSFLGQWYNSDMRGAPLMGEEWNSLTYLAVVSSSECISDLACQSRLGVKQRTCLYEAKLAQSCCSMEFPQLINGVNVMCDCYASNGCVNMVGQGLIGDPSQTVFGFRMASILVADMMVSNLNYDFFHGIVVPTEVGPSKVDPWTYRPFKIELGKLPRYNQTHKSVEFNKLN